LPEKNKKHNIEVLVDEIHISEASQIRLREAVERYGGGQPFDRFHLGLFQLFDVLAGICGKTLNIAPLPLSK
ncbi:unnamed protein product, partial [marine sediment metagenome]